MKIFLDDERKAPNGWVRCYRPEEVILLLLTTDVEVISLDHDLGEEDCDGYDVLSWLEEAVFVDNFFPPEILIHTANPAARVRMEACRKKIIEYSGRETG
jgi:hypothetical protein